MVDNLHVKVAELGIEFVEVVGDNPSGSTSLMSS